MAITVRLLCFCAFHYLSRACPAFPSLGPWTGTSSSFWKSEIHIVRGNRASCFWLYSAQKHGGIGRPDLTPKYQASVTPHRERDTHSLSDQSSLMHAHVHAHAHTPRRPKQPLKETPACSPWPLPSCCYRAWDPFYPENPRPRLVQDCLSSGRDDVFPTFCSSWVILGVG